MVQRRLATPLLALQPVVSGWGAAGHGCRLTRDNPFLSASPCFEACGVRNCGVIAHGGLEGIGEGSLV